LKDYITQFGTERFARIFAPCCDPYGCGDPARTEWPNNVLSIHTHVYDSGVIARATDSIVQRVDPDELARCERLAAAAAAIMGDFPVGMKSEAGEPFHAYFQVVSVDATGAPPGPPKLVDAALVRKLFGNTIAPFDQVFVEPFSEDGFAWKEMRADIGEEDDDEDPDDDEVIEREKVVGRWRELIRFFRESDELVEPSFAAIGFYEYAAPRGAQVLDAKQPPGFEMKGSCLPRMPFAFTRAGSLVGLFGHVVWT